MAENGKVTEFHDFEFGSHFESDFVGSRDSPQDICYNCELSYIRFQLSPVSNASGPRCTQTKKKATSSKEKKNYRHSNLRCSILRLLGALWTPFSIDY